MSNNIRNTFIPREITRLILSFSFSILLIFPNISYSQQDSFVYIKDGKFMLEGKEFFPLTITYAVQAIKDIHGNFHLSPVLSYCNYNNCGASSTGFNCGADSVEWRARIIKQIDKIAEMGFNTIRLNGLGVTYRPDKLKSKGLESNKYYTQDDPERLKCFTKHPGFKIKRKRFNQQIDLMEEFVDIIREYNKEHKDNQFKLILSLGTGGLQDYVWLYSKYLSAIGRRFSDEPIVFAYQINSEAFYLGYPKFERNKKYERAENFAQWYYALKDEAPSQLITLGTLVKDVYNWDPQCFPVDFINLHHYPKTKIKFDSDEAERYKSIIKWFSEVYDKPWIMGETSLAGNDIAHKQNSLISTEEQQKEFAYSSLAYTRYYGGIGFVWWQYKEVPWFKNSNPKAHENYYGLVRKKDKNENHKIAAEAFQAFDPSNECLTCFDPEPEVFFNPYNYPFLNIEGVVTTSDGKPVKNVYISCNAKNKNFYTFSDEKGRFKIYTQPDVSIYQLFASYPGMTVVELGYWRGPKLDSNLKLEINFLDKNRLPVQLDN